MGETRQKLVLQLPIIFFVCLFYSSIFSCTLIIWMIFFCLLFLRLENLKINTTVYMFAFVAAPTIALGCVFVFVFIYQTLFLFHFVLNSVCVCVYFVCEFSLQIWVLLVCTSKTKHNFSLRDTVVTLRSPCLL